MRRLDNCPPSGKESFRDIFDNFLTSVPRVQFQVLQLKEKDFETSGVVGISSLLFII